MGLLAKHLFVENAYENNLLSDIPKVDYLPGNQGRTNLRPFVELPALVGNMYIFGYLRSEDKRTVRVRGSTSCATDQGVSAQPFQTQWAPNETSGSMSTAMKHLAKIEKDKRSR